MTQANFRRRVRPKRKRPAPRRPGARNGNGPPEARAPETKRRRLQLDAAWSPPALRVDYACEAHAAPDVVLYYMDDASPDAFSPYAKREVGNDPGRLP